MVKYSKIRQNLSTITSITDQLLDSAEGFGPVSLLPCQLLLQPTELLTERLEHLVQLVGMLDQRLDGLRVGIILVCDHRVGRKTRALPGRPAFAHAARHADYRGARRHVLHHHRVRSDLGTVAHRDRTEDLGAGADHHALAERWVPLALVPRRPAERDAVVKRRVLADFGGFADDHAHAMVDEHAAPDCRARMNLDARQPAPEMRGEAPEPGQAVRPEPVRHAMDLQHMQSRIAGQDLPGIASRRVAIEDAADVFTQSPEHEGPSEFSNEHRNARVSYSFGQLFGGPVPQQRTQQTAQDVDLLALERRAREQPAPALAQPLRVLRIEEAA